jgi:hypothetical protein
MMKIIIKLIACITVSFVIVSCESILDKEDLTAVDESEVWNDLQLATAYISNIYHDNLPGWSAEEANMSDESRGGSSFMYGQLTENSVNYWPYSQIREINLLLTKIDDGTIAIEEKNRLKGEAYFFRAYRYFEMLKRYGGVPLVLVPQGRDDDLLVSRNSTSQTFEQIISDIDLAIKNLPAINATSGANNGRVHKGTALALKGRIVLYWASPQFDPSQTGSIRWQQAYNVNLLAKQQLENDGYGLYKSFEGLWFDEMNKEVIFVNRYERPAKTHSWAAATRPLDVSLNATGANWPILEMVNSFPMKDGKAIDDPTSNYVYNENFFWQNRDPRYQATIAYNGSLWELRPIGTGRIQWTFSGAESNNPTQTGFYMRKGVNINQNANEAWLGDTDWIEIRFAEVLLNLAEAANKAGNQEEAYNALKMIRDRAGIDPGVDRMYGLARNMTANDMHSAILLERKIELAYEGKRYWDLRRNRLFESLLNGTRRHGVDIRRTVSQAAWNIILRKSSSEIISDLNSNYPNYFVHTRKRMDTQFAINWRENYYFFAIPSQHLQLNSNLKQTKGWPGGTFDPLE